MQRKSAAPKAVRGSRTVESFSKPSPNCIMAIWRHGGKEKSCSRKENRKQVIRRRSVIAALMP
jgi:hypothetical protein